MLSTPVIELYVTYVPLLTPCSYKHLRSLLVYQQCCMRRLVSHRDIIIEVFGRLSSFLRRKCEKMTSHSFQKLSNSQFTPNPTIRCYKFSVTQNKTSHKLYKYVKEYDVMWQILMMFLFGLYITSDISIILNDFPPMNSCSTLLIICSGHHINMSWLRRQGLDKCRDEPTDQRKLCMVTK